MAKHLKTITVIVRGGIVQSACNVPLGYRVVVKDYDIDGSEEDSLKTDWDGEQYREVYLV